ncbi:MAG: spore coat associated protein CotJA [Lachnospiraceae bacterium]|nr:spore coat associated protein CotJA [Lachnospiraceae bacterium]
MRKEGKKVKDEMNEYMILNQFPLGMAYVPMQDFQRIYENLEKAFNCGTIFEELNKPFTGRRCVR